MTLVDTDILVDVIRGHGPAVAWFRSVTPLPAVAGFSVMELIEGARDRREVARIEGMVRPLPHVWATETECDAALSAFSRLRLSHGLGLIDAVIAAIAVSRSAVLFSFNAKHFGALPGLTFRTRYTR